MAAVAKDPKFVLIGTPGAYSFALTDPTGEVIASGALTYETLKATNDAARVFEDSIRYALPLVTPLG